MTVAMTITKATIFGAIVLFSGSVLAYSGVKATPFDEFRAGIRQGCHQDSVLSVAKKHHINGDNYAAVASDKRLIKYVDEITRLTESCVLREAAKRRLKEQ